jgi:hypothetical protein
MGEMHVFNIFNLLKESGYYYPICTLPYQPNNRKLIFNGQKINLNKKIKQYKKK